MGMTKIGDVLRRMEEIDAALPARDGLAWFNKLYWKTTLGIQEGLQTGAFENPALLEELDVAFAKLFFAAFDAASASKRVPRAWEPLFESRTDRKIAPIQFAIAGMNAHINRDLPFAVAEVAARHRVSLEEKGPYWRDFLVVNRILERTEQAVKVWFSTGFVGVIDETFGNVDDAVALWSIAHARSTAWENAEILTGLAHHPTLRQTFATALDRLVGFAGRGLLIET